MGRNTTHTKRSWAMHFASYPFLSLFTSICTAVAEVTQLTSTFFSRSYSNSQSLSRAKACVAHFQRREDILLGKLIKASASNSVNNFPKSDVTNVAVCKPASRRISEWLLDESFDCLVVAGPLFP